MKFERGSKCWDFIWMGQLRLLADQNGGESSAFSWSLLRVWALKGTMGCAYLAATGQHFSFEFGVV